MSHEIRDFSENPVLITVGLLYGNSKTGFISEFAPEELTLSLTMTVRRSGGKNHESLEDIDIEEISYIAFHNRNYELNDPSEKEVREYEISSSGKKRFRVEANPHEVSDPVGFYATPISRHSLYSEIFFFSDNITFIEDTEPLGHFLLREGVIKKRQLERGLSEQRALRNMKLGEILIDQSKVKTEDVERAVAKQMDNKGKKKPMRLGEVLVEAGLATEEDIQKALKAQKKQKGKRLGEVLVDLGIISESVVSSVLAKKFHLPFVDLDKTEIVPEAISEIPPDLIKRYRVFPFFSNDTDILIAMGDPLGMEALDMLRFSIGKHIQEMIAKPSQIESYLEPFLRLQEEREAQEQEYSEEENFHELDLFLEGLADSEGDEGEEESIAVKLVNRIIIDAYRQGASDIHIEPYGPNEPTVIRFRTDGACARYKTVPGEFASQIVGRIKILASLDIAERRNPQDGKIKFPIGSSKLELRVATIPTAGRNEDVVMRLLASSKPIALDNLGLTDDNNKKIKSCIRQPYGLILAVGPTGSGKTTTLHSLLGYINEEERKIWTAEDPVEITQVGLRQVEVQSKIGFTFAKAMKAFLRADPDVVMVGEMRDHETAAIGIEASLTGHLVFSTLHTNNAPETITRLLDMELDPFSFSDALLLVLAQRLARRLCSECRETFEASEAEYTEIADYYGKEKLDEKLDGKPLKLWRGAGCKKCNQTGYKGRVGLHEVLVNSDDLRHAILQKATANQLRELALKEGMRTLLQDGIEKCLEGLTDLKQVLAVCSR